MIPDVPVAFWQFFDVISLTFIFLVLGFLLVSHKKRSGNLLRSISQTVAATKKSSLAFSVVMTIFFPLYYAFLWFWVWPHASVPLYLYFLLLLSAVFEMIFVWVPATEGISRRIHELSAGAVGAFMLFVPLVILTSGLTSIAGTDSIWLFFVISLALFALATTTKYSKYTFLYECIYCLAFLISMSVVAHT